ncbi:MAG: DinB family protein [Bacteroidia bacterium]
MKRPEKNEYPEYFERYIQLVKGENLIRTLEGQMLEMQALISDLPSEKEDYAYAAGKWTIKEVLGHLIDCERILGYRALRFLRGDSQPLLGFDDKEFVTAGVFNRRTFYDLAHEFSVLREANIILFKNQDDTSLSRKGFANNQEVSARAMAYFIAGHTTHHIQVIKSHYLE